MNISIPFKIRESLDSLIILYKVQDKVTFELRVTIILYKVQDYQFVE